MKLLLSSPFRRGLFLLITISSLFPFYHVPMSMFWLDKQSLTYRDITLQSLKEKPSPLFPCNQSIKDRIGSWPQHPQVITMGQAMAICGACRPWPWIHQTCYLQTRPQPGPHHSCYSLTRPLSPGIKVVGSTYVGDLSKTKLQYF